MARSLVRRLGSLTYSANGITMLELPRNHVYKGLLCRLTGTLDTTVIGTALNSEEPQSLIRRLRIIRNGSEYLQSLDGGSLYALATINRGTTPQRSAVGTTGVATTAFSCDIPIDFAALKLLPDAVNMSLLRSPGASSLFLEVTWGTADSILTGGTKTFTVTPTLEIFSSPEIMDITGNFADKNLTVIEKIVTASSTRFEIDLPVGPLYRRIAFKTTDSTNADDFLGRNDIINTISLEIDGVLRLVDNVSFIGLRGHNKDVYGVETMPLGYAIWDAAEDGSPAGYIVTAGASTLKAILDVTVRTGTTRVRAIPEYYIPGKLPVVG